MSPKVASLIAAITLAGIVLLVAMTRPEQPAVEPVSAPPVALAPPALPAARSGPESPPSTIEDHSPAQGFAIQLPQSVTLPAVYGDIGPQLLEAGAIDPDRFTQVFERSGNPLTDSQRAVLFEGSDETIAIDHQNAHFLLNLLWAFGLANRNPILESGPLVEYSEGDIGRFASTGGWTVGSRPATELYAAHNMLTLTDEQQGRLEQVAENVYRPCCNNHTAFADCNHGMAMLGLLELLAAQGATELEMYDAARWVNAFWFPRQALETALFAQVALQQDYAALDPRMAVGPQLASSTGFASVHQWLLDNNLLDGSPGGGSSCGV
jgi:hypothetical protein